MIDSRGDCLFRPQIPNQQHGSPQQRPHFRQRRLESQDLGHHQGHMHPYIAVW